MSLPLAGTPVKNWSILLKQSFTAYMPLLTATSAFRFGRSSGQTINLGPKSSEKIWGPTVSWRGNLFVLLTPVWGPGTAFPRVPLTSTTVEKTLGREGGFWRTLRPLRSLVAGLDCTTFHWRLFMLLCARYIGAAWSLPRSELFIATRQVASDRSENRRPPQDSTGRTAEHTAGREK